MVTSPATPLYDPCGGVLGLDFANTVSRAPDGSGPDAIRSYADLCRWARESGRLAPGRARALGRLAADRPEDAVRVLERARALREATFWTFHRQVHGKPPRRADLETINAAVADAFAHARVDRVGGEYVWGWCRDESLDAPLWPIARSVADLLTSPERNRVRECASETCLWLFLDRTKNGRRRWCEMKTCGNRAKVRAHRRRKNAAGG